MPINNYCIYTKNPDFIKIERRAFSKLIPGYLFILKVYFNRFDKISSMQYIKKRLIPLLIYQWVIYETT